jgi:hypothetical protein
VNFPDPIKLRDAKTGDVFVFATDSPTDYRNMYRKVVAPYVSGEETPFGIKYQPKDDGNSCHMVSLLQSVVYRAQADMMVVVVPDVKVTVRVRDVWTYGPVDPE